MRTKADETKTFTVNLLMAGRPCLVVGGGKIAARKLQALIQSGASITLIAPKISEEVETLCSKANARTFKRPFEDSDLEGVNLVFAATDDKNLNARILRLARAYGALACAVDENWTDGSFITPATFEGAGIKVSVSSGGVSCRRSRIIKESLSRHVEMLEGAGLLIIGLDHNYLSLSEREPYHLLGAKYESAGAMLTHVWGLHEFMILNTCNRIELIAIASPGDDLESLLLRILGFDSLQEGSFYIKRGWEAFSHLPVVAAGLMSQTPGEKHIVAQLKDAMAIARERAWAGTLMQDWFDSSLHISKHIRAEAEPHFRNYEIEDLAVTFIKDQTKELKGLRAIVIGSGQVGSAVARMLMETGCHVDWFYHSNKPEPFECDGGGSLSIFNLNQLKDRLQDADIVVTAAASPAPLIHHGHAPFMDQSRRMLMLDLGTPRNISHELSKLMSNIKLRDMDDLKHWHRREFVDMSMLFEISSKIIGTHRESYDKILSGLQGGDSRKQARADAN